MTVKKISKFVLAWMCIISILMPFTADVLAATLTKDSETAILESVPWREGGPESTGVTSNEYDENSYAYKVSGVNVLKVIQEGDTSFSDAFYCLNAEKSLSITSSYDYEKVAENLKDSSNAKVANLINNLGMSEENFKSLIWLLENIYLEKQQPELKDAYLEKAFAKLIEEEADVEPPTTVEFIKERLTDDDIDVVQQWAIWYFTNGSNSENSYYDALYSAFGQMSVTYETLEDGQIVEKAEDLNSTRQRYAAELYNYLVTSAKAAVTENSEKEEVIYPTIDKTKTITSEVDGTYYKVGPFKVNSGNISSSEYEISLTSEGANLSDVDYKISVNGNFTDKEFYEILDEEYYIYVPIANNKITKINLALKYVTRGEINASLWESATDPETLQPLTLLMYVPGEEVPDSVTGVIVEKSFDLSLRKFIVSVDENSVDGRTPTTNVDKLVQGENTAEYKHAKNPVTVEKGSRIIYEFRVYNEGDVENKVNEIVDYLPEGLTVVDKAKSTINSKYNWEVVGTSNGFTIIKNTYLADKDAIPAFNKETKNLSYAKVQLECEVTGDFDGGTVLTNVAQISKDNGLDRDSKANSIDPKNIDKVTYSGNVNNDSDLTKKDYYYAGLEDDDDFEKIVIEGKVFDLALQKFITKVNDEDYSSLRTPKANVTPLVNGENDAKYETVKTPVQVEVGDVVTFTLRVYNEGQVSGYAEKVMDYIPEGLGFLVNYKTNYENSWTIAQDATSVKLSEIKNGDDNLKVSDFVDVDSLEEVEVVVGKTKITSTALASSTTSTENLIKAFDGTTLSYKDIEVTCIVMAEDEVSLKNIAAVIEESDEERKPVEKDRDSVPTDNINPDKYTTGNEDDDDYDVINTSVKHYDFALQKFIVALNDTEIKDRIPAVVLNNEEKLQYNHKSEALTIGNGDLITYTIRVYNEGNIEGYVSEISDDIPNGLVFLPESDVNKTYGWKMYDKSGKETEDINQAVQIRTDYLSKEKSVNNVIPAFNPELGVTENNPSYKDVKVVFKLDETLITKTSSTEERTIINTAEITEITDTDGDEVEDIDSTPDNGKLEEDDIDQEKVYVKYFDLSLVKNLKKIIFTEGDETTVIDVTNPESLMKVEVHRKRLNKTSIQFVYEIVVTNEGEIEGYATEITDYIPKGLDFNKDKNPLWTEDAENIITTDALAKTLLKPNEKASVEVTLDWVRDENNIGKFINVAEISEDFNTYNSEDVDSTPNNLISTEDDQDDEPVYVSIGTGLSGEPYFVLTAVVLAILGTGIFLIKKYVLE